MSTRIPGDAGGPDHYFLLVGAVVDAIDRAGTRASNLAGDLDRARVQASTRTSDLTRPRQLAGGLTRASASTSELARQLRDLRARVELVHQGSAVQGTSRARVAAPASRLAGLAVWLLPADGRARYSEEFACELWEMANHGAGRRAQLAFAIQLLSHAAPLRMAVLSPRRKGAAP